MWFVFWGFFPCEFKGSYTCLLKFNKVDPVSPFCWWKDSSDGIRCIHTILWGNIIHPLIMPWTPMYHFQRGGGSTPGKSGQRNPLLPYQWWAPKPGSFSYLILMCCQFIGTLIKFGVCKMLKEWFTFASPSQSSWLNWNLNPSPLNPSLTLPTVPHWVSWSPNPNYTVTEVPYCAIESSDVYVVRVYIYSTIRQTATEHRQCSDSCPLKILATETGETLGRTTFRTEPKNPKNPQ